MDHAAIPVELADVDEAGLVRLAEVIALGLGSGDEIHLIGDLGAGKTTFARALIRAFCGDVGLEVVSPTFSLVQTYDSPRGRIEHFDLYRLRDSSEAEEIGLSDAAAAGTIRIIEWPDRLGDRLSSATIAIEIQDAMQPSYRTLRLSATGNAEGRLRRALEAHSFVVGFGWSDASIHYLQGDASTRRYARLIAPGGTSAILMDSPSQGDGPVIRDGMTYSQIAHLAETVKPFVAVAHALRSAGLSAPEIMASDLESGFLLLEDLGDRVFGREAEGDARQTLLWGAAVDMLIQFRKADLPVCIPVSPGQRSAGMHTLPRLDATILGIEVALLPEWLWPEVCGGAMPAGARAEFDNIWRPLIQRILDAPPGWILRDVHSPNLLWLPARHGVARVGIIDFQDAIIGPWAHDLMSLLQDARADVPETLELKLLDHYCREMSGHPGFDEDDFRTVFAVYGALRATRLLGLFVRLLRRDGKPGYLAHIPRNWRYLERNLRHPALSGLEKWYARHFPAEVRTRAIIP